MMYRSILKQLVLVSTLVLLFADTTLAQMQKVVNEQTQSWVSVNTTARLSSKWGLILDVHEKRNNLFHDNSFHFLRGGVNFWLTENITFAAGYGHLWLAPTNDGWTTFSNENRIYEQAQLTSKIGSVSMLQRLRLEHRWQQRIVDDVAIGGYKFSNRFRYLLSFTIPVSNSALVPSAVFANEVCLQNGKEVVYNTFDQNRLFIGVKQKVSAHLQFDLGYMLVYQQKSAGTVYDKNHTFRLFFYYTPDLWRKMNDSSPVLQR